MQLVAIILIAPWLSTTHTYDDVFAAQPRLVNKSWCVSISPHENTAHLVPAAGLWHCELFHAFGYSRILL